jgi:hypothetical protein
VQGQIASFFALDGPSHVLDPYDASQISDPDGAGPLFEVPIQLPLPTRLNYPSSASLALTGDVAPSASEPVHDGVRVPATLVAHPSPLRDGVLDVWFALDALGRTGARATLVVYDLGGRSVRTLEASGVTPGGRRFTWDGRNDRGDAVAPGVYLLRAEDDGRTAETKVVVVH